MTESSDTPEKPSFPSPNEEGMDQIEYRYSLDGTKLVAVDERYGVFPQAAPGIQMRVAVSYGPDVRLTNAGGGTLVRPPEGTMIFGCHHIGTKGRRFALFGSWLDEHDASGVTGEAIIVSRAKDILASMDDKRYEWLLTQEPSWRGRTMELGRSACPGPWEEVSAQGL